MVGDGYLNYYLYNWNLKVGQIKPSELAVVLVWWHMGKLIGKISVFLRKYLTGARDDDGFLEVVVGVWAQFFLEISFVQYFGFRGSSFRKLIFKILWYAVYLHLHFLKGELLRWSGQLFARLRVQIYIYLGDWFLAFKDRWSLYAIPELLTIEIF